MKILNVIKIFLNLIKMTLIKKKRKERDIRYPTLTCLSISIATGHVRTQKAGNSLKAKKDTPQGN